jgi:TctA family transporter
MGIAAQLFSPEVSGKCQQAQDFGPMITLAVPITAILAVLGFMLGVYGAWINPKPKVAQTSTSVNNPS